MKMVKSQSIKKFILKFKEKIMKKKILLTLAIIAVFTCLFAFAVSAANIVHDGIYYSTTVTDAEAKIGTATLNTSNVNCALEKVNIPETFKYEDGITYTVIGLDASAFGGSGWPGNKTIKEVTIPKTVKSIGNHCFRNCTNLEKVVNKAAGGEYSFTNAEFYNCTSLKIIDFSEAYGLRSMGEHLFTNCSNIETVLLPEGLENIASSVFSGKSKITEIKLPSTLERISGKQAFSSTAFTSIVLPTGLTALGNNIFQASKLESIVIPANVASVGEHCFNNAKNLKYVVIANPDVSNYNNAMFYQSSVDVVFFAGTEENARAFAARLSQVSLKNFVSYEDYLKNPDVNSYSDTIVFGTENLACGNIDTNEPATFNFTGYTEALTYGKTCAHCQKTDVVESYKAMFVCLGWTASEEDPNAAVAIRYQINKESINVYETETGKTVEYGMYATVKSALGNNAILDENGVAGTGAIKVSIPEEYVNLEIKFIGIGQNTDALFALGAFVKVTKDEETKYELLEYAEPKTGDNYYFTSYNEIIGA